MGLRGWYLVGWGDTQVTFDEILEMLPTLEVLHQENVSVSVTTNDLRVRMMDHELERLTLLHCSTREVRHPPLSRPVAGPDLVHLHFPSLYLDNPPPGLPFHFYLRASALYVSHRQQRRPGDEKLTSK